MPDASKAEAIVRVRVTNAGDRSGSDVVQVYVGDPECTVDRPVRELRAFAKVRLAPGESTVVELVLTDRAFAYWGPTGWTVEPGAFVIEAGASSRDIYGARTVTLDVPPVIPQLNADSTVEEWLAHPTGARLVTALIEQGSPMLGMLEIEDFSEMAAQMPLVTIAEFAKPGQGSGFVADLLRQVESDDAFTTDAVVLDDGHTDSTGAQPSR